MSRSNDMTVPKTFGWPPGGWLRPPDSSSERFIRLYRCPPHDFLSLILNPAVICKAGWEDAGVLGASAQQRSSDDSVMMLVFMLRGNSSSSSSSAYSCSFKVHCDRSSQPQSDFNTLLLL
ncbi:unnamed protein product [Pleuronectes platessa]|uniref:Uncharacterized protein n=1 Tax=Pleuronectes platessa TaxID=8262 RepID=A0A9N7U4P1_PLEPL|nr:unnamed protein product [Pleuronectes platessa]